MTLQVATDDFKGWFDAVLVSFVKTARSSIEHEKQVPPHMLVIERDPNNPNFGIGRLAYFSISMNENHEKDMNFAMARMLASDPTMVGGVIICTETWYLAVDKDDKAGIEMMRSKEGISKRDDKKEAVMWTALRGNMQLMAFAEVETIAGERIMKAPKVIDAAVEGIRGRLVGGDDQKDN